MDIDEGALEARVVNLVLGIWLFVSAFVWKHTGAQLANTWIVGVVAVLVALIAVRLPRLRYLNSLLAMWLFVSAFALPHLRQGTVWNNALLALVMFFVSLQSTEEPTGDGLPSEETTARESVR
jgi:hypothetical protein